MNDSIVFAETIEILKTKNNVVTKRTYNFFIIVSDLLGFHVLDNS